MLIAGQRQRWGCKKTPTKKLTCISRKINASKRRTSHDPACGKGSSTRLKRTLGACTMVFHSLVRPQSDDLVPTNVPSNQMQKKQPLKRGSRPSLQASKIDQLSRKAGFTIDKLHTLWMSGRSGDPAADKKVHDLLAKHPAISAVFEVFVQGHDPKQRRQLRRQLVEANPPKKPETVWSASKPRWVSVVNGGLPTLGKRR